MYSDLFSLTPLPHPTQFNIIQSLPSPSNRRVSERSGRPEVRNQTLFFLISQNPYVCHRLSLSMFEALRRLRDAVAPESGNLGGNQNENKDDAGSQQQQSSSSSSSDQPDFEEFWQNYESGDSATVALVHKVNGGKPPAKREDYGRIHLLVEMEKDRELVRELATTILEKSAEIDQRVSDLPGMQRTKHQQMKQIEKLIDSNRQVAEELEAAYQTAEERRDKVRKFVKDNTCSALGILEDSEQQ